MKIKTFLLILLIVILTACSAGPNLNRSAEQVAAASAKIADFDLPDGYRADFSASLLGYSMAAFNNGDGHSHLYLIQSENVSDGEKLAGMLDQMAPGSSDAKTRTRVIETLPVTIRGEETPLILSEGINSEGDAYRQATAAFQGKGGPAMLVFSEPVNHWSQVRIDALLRSIR